MMQSVVSRPYAGDHDLDSLVELINICEAVDRLDWGTSAGELRAEFTQPGVDQQRDLRLWLGAGGQLLGFGQLHRMPTEHGLDGFLWLCVHPEARGAGLGQAIVRWGQARLAELGDELGLPTTFLTGARSDDRWRSELLQRAGFTPLRYFLRLSCPLGDPPPAPRPPEGFVLRPLAGRQEAAGWVELFNLSFVDHFNFHPLTLERRLHWFDEPFYKPELDLVAVAPDGTLAAFAYCTSDEQEQRRLGIAAGWINNLGTRRGYRNMGLGRAILLAGMHALRHCGATLARLGVDADNPTGALRLYESAGFQREYSMVHYRLDTDLIHHRDTGYPRSG